MAHRDCSSAIPCTQSMETFSYHILLILHKKACCHSFVLKILTHFTSALTIFSDLQVLYTGFVSQNRLTSQSISILQSTGFLFLLKQIIIDQRRRENTQQKILLFWDRTRSIFYFTVSNSLYLWDFPHFHYQHYSAP